VPTKRTARSRDRSKGVAVIELALSMLFLIPLLCAAVDFGYYFYVGSNVEEAARQGALQGARMRASLGANCNGVIELPAEAVIQNVHPVGSGVSCLNAGVVATPDVVSAVYCYMNEPPLSMGPTSGPTSVTTISCDANPVANSWHIQVDVSFPLLLGFYRPLFPAGASAGTVRYRATATATP